VHTTATAYACCEGRNKTRALALTVVHLSDQTCWLARLKGTGTTKQTDPVKLRQADSGGLLGRGPQRTHGKQSGGKDCQRRPSEVGG